MLLAGLVVGCSTVPNPLYCDESADCKNGLVCNPDTHGCEQPGDAGVDAEAGCALDDECPSGVCRGDGSCELADQVLYVSVDGVSAGECPEATRCDITYALSKVTPSKHTLRLANGVYDLASSVVISPGSPDVTIVGGKAAVLRRTSTGPVMSLQGTLSNPGPTLTVRGMTVNKGVECVGSGLRIERVVMDSAPSEVLPWVKATGCRVEILRSELLNSPSDGVAGEYSDLDVSDSTIARSQGYGVMFVDGDTIGKGVVHITTSTISNHPKIGVRVVNGTSFTMTRSFVSTNHLGGVESLGQSFDITNNFVVRNGSQGNTLGVDSSNFGGLHLSGAGTSRLLYNTVAMNNSDPAALYAGGVFCDGGNTGSNLISYNQRGNEEFPRAATGGTCSFAGSIIDQSIAAVDSKFADLFNDDFHLTSASPARNAGNGVPPVDVDFDGDPRSDGSPDFGADEVP